MCSCRHQHAFLVPWCALCQTPMGFLKPRFGRWNPCCLAVRNAWGSWRVEALRLVGECAFGLNLNPHSSEISSLAELTVREKDYAKLIWPSWTWRPEAARLARQVQLMWRSSWQNGHVILDSSDLIEEFDVSKFGKNVRRSSWYTLYIYVHTWNNVLRPVAWCVALR